MTPEIKARIAKIYELVKRGTDGEQAAAQAALHRILSKYNLEDINLESINKDNYKFKYTTRLDNLLLSRLLIFLIDDKDARAGAYKSTANGKEIVVQLTYLDYITIQASYAYFKKHMKSQWMKVIAPEINKCRTVKTRNQLRKKLEMPFFQKYLIASKLYKSEELTTVDVRSKAALELHYKLQNVEGGNYHIQMTSGLLLN